MGTRCRTEDIRRFVQPSGLKISSVFSSWVRNSFAPNLNHRIISQVFLSISWGLGHCMSMIRLSLVIERVSYWNCLASEMAQRLFIHRSKPSVSTQQQRPHISFATGCVRYCGIGRLKIHAVFTWVWRREEHTLMVKYCWTKPLDYSLNWVRRTVRGIQLVSYRKPGLVIWISAKINVGDFIRNRHCAPLLKQHNKCASRSL